jgi:hypothetical protein
VENEKPYKLHDSDTCYALRGLAEYAELGTARNTWKMYGTGRQGMLNEALL